MMAQQNEAPGKPVAIVTGAGQGIGLAISRELASQGSCVLLNDIDPVLTGQAAASIEKEFGHCFGLHGDSGDVGFIRSMVDEAVRRFGRLTTVVANAGITLFGDFLEYEPEAFQRIVHTNLRGGFFLAQAAARQMIRQGGGGSILFMSSVTGHQAHKNLAAYGMTKAALEMLARNLVMELSPYRITVNAIAPGATVTERTSGDPGYTAIWSDITPMGRPATTADIAYAAAFLVSERATHITGQTLIVDGGWTVVSPSPYR
ncbi:MAG: SDR family oxidoreductase [Bacteroidota bacterium]|nr:SDR family oxidoreductase [Bacteroidota bacterium]MDP4215483.1 SDR family oxidoreductase [Bacteroidota bacterium]MDP4246723.1 SDR family oxidoreductase [Bacteroidota bacterium]MDP4252560.1 SDR family oxidoreductase [Bacteroidota bacterium]MDP4257804.1 SDR family oxidoreductase [Bacteroidota bacterium]